ncbi:MAG: sulfotransferase family protein [Candidatus Limnocylindria bacterium]
MPKPDFFIVGAPRSGTTAMYEYLRRHPQVFMPEHKEPQYFGADLAHLHDPLTEEEYLRLFRAAKPGQRVGEATTWYLYSRTAASEIRAFAPEAQIVIMLRNPVDMMYSLYQELSYYRGEVYDFETALAAEPERRAGRKLGVIRRPEVHFYRAAAQFAPQVERYYEAFGRERVKVIIFDDFVADAAAAYRDLLRFLGVDDTFATSFERVNESKRPRNALLQDMVIRPPRLVARLIPLLRRFPSAHRLRLAVLSANSEPVERPPLDPALRRRLTEDFMPQVRRLGELIGRDLSAWSRVDGPATPPKDAVISPG